jgi:hypothetical protein
VLRCLDLFVVVGLSFVVIGVGFGVRSVLA